MARSPASRARRTLSWTAALVLVLVLGLAAAVQFGTAAWTPKLGLDLAGGTEIILTPEVRPGQGTITAQTIANSIAIIRERVDSTGTSEAQVSSQGQRNIVVDLPGDPAQQHRAVALVSQSAQMTFRPVLTEAGTAPTPSPSASATPTPSGTASGTASAAASPGASATASSTASAVPSGAATAPAATATSATPAGDRVPAALRAASASPSASATATPSATAAAASATPSATPGAASATPSAAATASAGSTPSAIPTSPSDLSQVTPAIAAQFSALDCGDPVAVGTAAADDPTKPLVTCSRDGAVKYVLGPVEVKGTDISSAAAGLATTSTGASTNDWIINLSFDGAGRKAFAASSTRLYGLTAPQNEFAIVLDGVVVSSPAIDQGPITDGRAQISGSFTEKSATTLANQLKFGALPISFHVQTTDEISALLGSEQLQRGLLAGLIGLALVVVYSLLQYRLLGLVTVGSLALAGVFSLLAVDLLSWHDGFRLSLAGVAGFIVSIGITADSFIVFFERVRDEVREGRGLRAAVGAGWARGRRTIVISDAVNFLAAATLYVLAVGNVRGFAFTLGLTTLIDLVVVFGFTHPVLVLLARRPFFEQGRRLSGFEADRLGREAYAGRGAVSGPGGRRRAGGATVAGGEVPSGAGAPAPTSAPSYASAPAPTGATAATSADLAHLADLGHPGDRARSRRRGGRTSGSASQPDEPQPPRAEPREDAVGSPALTIAERRAEREARARSGEEVPAGARSGTSRTGPHDADPTDQER